MASETGASVPGPRLVTAPKGVYCRLPAHRDHDAEGAGPPSTAEDLAEPQRGPRRRGAPARVEAPNRAEGCDFDGRASMAGRLKVLAHITKEPCGVCSSLTAAICRRCGARLCMACARDRRSYRDGRPVVDTTFMPEASNGEAASADTPEDDPIEAGADTTMSSGAGRAVALPASRADLLKALVNNAEPPS